MKNGQPDLEAYVKHFRDMGETPDQHEREVNITRYTDQSRYSNKILGLWAKAPSLRFGQFVSCVVSHDMGAHIESVSQEEIMRRLFYMTDEEFVAACRAFVEAQGGIQP